VRSTPDVDAGTRQLHQRHESNTRPVPELAEDSTLDEHVRYALYHSPKVEAAYQRWVAAAARVPQVAALPDPRLTLGYFLEEVQTRTGAQEARFGAEQTFPWLRTLRGRKDAASRNAAGAWHEFQNVRLEVRESVSVALLDLAYLDASTRIARETLELLRSFEGILRAGYRVGTESHPELVRVQVELGQLEDRIAQLEAMRPTRLADVNHALNRPIDTHIQENLAIEERVIVSEVDELTALATQHNPRLLALDQKIEEHRALQSVASSDSLPDITIGIDYMLTDDAINALTPGSGDDPVLLRLGMNVPIWREKYSASEREAIARRLSAASSLTSERSLVHAQIQRAWFEHTDADRRVRMFEHTLMPKAEESLRVSISSFRAGETSLLDLLDTERTLLEFSLAVERAKAERGKTLARLATLVGVAPSTRPANDEDRTETQSEVAQ
jgi:outer membrane protein TolC